MQQSKDIKNLSELPKIGIENSELHITKFNSCIKEFNLSVIFGILGCCESKGISPKVLFKVLFLLPYVEVKNIYNLFECGLNKDVMCKKDAFYEF